MTTNNQFTKGQFGYVTLKSGMRSYGFVQSGKQMLGVDKGGICGTVGLETFIPCHEALPLEPTFKEWCRMAFTLMPELLRIHINNRGLIVGRFKDNTYETVLSSDWHFKGGVGEYIRADLFPEPEPDYSTYVGQFCKFWNEPEEPDNENCVFATLFSYDKSYFRPFTVLIDGMVRRFLHARPYTMPQPLDPAKLGEG